MNNNHINSSSSAASDSSDPKRMNHQTNGRVHLPPRASNSLSNSNNLLLSQQQTPFIIDNNKNYSNLNFNQMMLNNQMMMSNPIFFQNHLLSQQQHLNGIATTSVNNNNNLQPIQMPITIIPNNSQATTTTTMDNNAVDVDDFALFQQEQAKQFSFFQQQQAAMFLQMAALQQQQQLETLANGVLGPYIHASLSNSTSSYGGEDDAASSLPMFIPTSTSPSVNILNNTNNTPALDLYSTSPMKDSLLSSSPSNQMSVSVDGHSTNTDTTNNNDPENEDKRSQMLTANQRRTGPVRRSKKGGWSEEEDEMLRRAVQLYGGKNWKKIAETLQNRTSVQCLHRWQKVLNPNLVKGPWTKEEDETILQLVKTYGAENWSMIASHLPGRIGKQCRERWYNHLDPSIKKEPWTEEEEQLLLEAQRKLGNKWAEISKQIPGRTDNACKNHFNSLIAREKKKASSTDCPITEATTKKTKKPTTKKDDTSSRSKHKRSLSDTVFYQNFKYEPKDSLLAPPTLSPMATSSNSGNNSPRSNDQQQHLLPPPHPSSQPTIFPTFINPSSSNVTPFSLNFPFSNTNVTPLVIHNGNIIQQNVIPLSKENVQKSTAQDTPSQLIIPNIDITSPNSTATPSDLFHDASAFDATEGPNSVLSDVQDTLINQVGSSFTNFDNFEFENEVLIHENSNEEGSNNSATSGQKNARPSTVFDEEMDFNDMDESELHNFLEEDDEDEQTNSGLLPTAFIELDSRQVKRKKFNHIFHNRSISFDVSQLQNKDQFF